MTIAELFRGKRKDAGLSLREAGKRMSTGYGHLCQIESGLHTNLTVRTLLAAQRLYGITDRALLAAMKETFQ